MKKIFTLFAATLFAAGMFAASYGILVKVQITSLQTPYLFMKPTPAPA